jgi:uncharacterized phage protein gp47/JayE
MAIEMKDFETMVSDTLYRIASSTNITNINPGSVIRTIVESILAEVDIEYYQINKLALAMDINTATGEDLDGMIKIIGVTRNNATKCVTGVTFGRSTAFQSDIAIPYGTIISTKPDNDGTVIEFMVSRTNEVLIAGQLTVIVDCIALVAGSVYIPTDTLTIMNSPILNIEYVTNVSDISGGTNTETDSSLRTRAKNSLFLLGKGTMSSLESAIMDIDGVNYAKCIDKNRGVGTVDIIVVTASIPSSEELQLEIEGVVEATKAAGIDTSVLYTSIKNVVIDISTTGFTNASVIKSGILKYTNTLNAGSPFIINQMERYILNECNSPDMDILTMEPTHNIITTVTQIARADTITVNGVVV